jgi:hypothetical protein
MTALIDDDVVHEFAVVGTYDALPTAIEHYFGGLTDSIAIDPATPAEQVKKIRRLATGAAA